MNKKNKLKRIRKTGDTDNYYYFGRKHREEILLIEKLYERNTVIQVTLKFKI